MSKPKAEWAVIVDLLREINPTVLNRIGRKMMNYLFKRNVKEAEDLMLRLNEATERRLEEVNYNPNEPSPRVELTQLERFIDEVFNIASQVLDDEEITTMISLWMKQDQLLFFTNAIERRDCSLAEITDAIHRYTLIPDASRCFSPDESNGIRAALIRRFLSENLEYINTTKKHVSINDFQDLVSRTIGPSRGNGKLGGKAAGLFRAERILRSTIESQSDYIVLRNLTVPKTWYITSDGIIDFLHYNALEEVPSIKYRNTSEIRKEFGYLEQIFKNSPLSPGIVTKLSLALDDFGDKPIIVRSSSLLEDSLGSAFAGKYKSLFVPNVGTKTQRLAALSDAVVEVYSSIFGPDPIEYRRERGLLDFNEEMAIVIQEVVGRRVGKYYFPAFAGVAMSRNEFRWSPRIKRTDGIIRLVAGLGTRAVDRVGDDYPTLICPAQPGLRVNVTPEDILYYSQKKIDVINMETCRFETLDLGFLLQECGKDFPAMSQVFSIYRDGQILPTVGNMMNLNDGVPTVTFANLIQRSPFIPELKAMLKILEESLGYPVDIEFAFEGDVHKPYLLQCRPQSMGDIGVTIPVPRDVPESDRLFSANRFVTSAQIEGLEYVVYVDPLAYDALPTMDDLVGVGKLVAELNSKLPARKFLLMGPGRWGSRGDIKLGVRVTYSDINNTAMLIEIAKSKKGYVPELSFGTHFFQDLVEANIRYLPLYPDDKGVFFNESFFKESSNLLRKFVPGAKTLEHVVSVIHVPRATDDATLSVIMDGDNDQALAFLKRR